MNELTVIEPAPQELFRKSTDVASVCAEIVKATATNIQGKSYVSVEGWESLAIAHGCFLGSGEAERAYDRAGEHIGYTAKGFVRNSTGVIISTAEGYVGFDEKDRKGSSTWGSRAEYAGRAMAQTRAMSRAGRAAFAHVVVLMKAGLSTTPAEEVPAEGFQDAPRPVQASKPVTDDRPSWEEAKPDFRSVAIHFGKLQGVALAEMKPHQLQWWVETWMPSKENDPRTSADDRRLVQALKDYSEWQKKQNGN